jgi:hypothetical protein
VNGAAATARLRGRCQAFRRLGALYSFTLNTSTHYLIDEHSVDAAGIREQRWINPAEVNSLSDDSEGAP